MSKYITLFKRKKYSTWHIAEEKDINHPFSKEIYEFKEINVKHEHILKAYLNDDVTIKVQTTTGLGGAPIVQICSDFIETYNENNIYIIDRVNNKVESDQLYQDICILVDEVSNNLDYKKMYEQSEELNKKYVDTVASLNERVDEFKNRTCESCKHCDNMKDIVLCIHEDNIQEYLGNHKMQVVLDFGCNKWESNV